MKDLGDDLNKWLKMNFFATCHYWLHTFTGTRACLWWQKALFSEGISVNLFDRSNTAAVKSMNPHSHQHTPAPPPPPPHFASHLCHLCPPGPSKVRQPSSLAPSHLWRCTAPWRLTCLHHHQPPPPPVPEGICHSPGTVFIGSLFLPTFSRWPWRKWERKHGSVTNITFQI